MDFPLPAVRRVVNTGLSYGKKGVNPAAGSPTATLLRLRSSCKMEFGSCAGGGKDPHCPPWGPLWKTPSPPLENACNPPYSRSVTGGEYKAQVLIHRGVLIHDY